MKLKNDNTSSLSKIQEGTTTGMKKIFLKLITMFLSRCILFPWRNLTSEPHQLLQTECTNILEANNETLTTCYELATITALTDNCAMRKVIVLKSSISTYKIFRFLLINNLCKGELNKVMKKWKNNILLVLRMKKFCEDFL